MAPVSPVAYILGKINEAAASQGTRSPNTPLFDSYVWQSPSSLLEWQPTMRLDYNLIGFSGIVSASELGKQEVAMASLLLSMRADGRIGG